MDQISVKLQSLRPQRTYANSEQDASANTSGLGDEQQRNAGEFDQARHDSEALTKSDNVKSFIHISDGKLHDVHALDMLVPEAGAIYVMDRGYIDFGRPYGLHQAGAFFVIRAKSNLSA